MNQQVTPIRTRGRQLQPRQDWTVVLRRQPVRLVDGQPEGGYSSLFEIICCDCGDHPDLDYREVPRKLQQIRGPYPIAAGVEAYVSHVSTAVLRTVARARPRRPWTGDRKSHFCRNRPECQPGF